MNVQIRFILSKNAIMVDVFETKELAEKEMDDRIESQIYIAGGGNVEIMTTHYIAEKYFHGNPICGKLFTSKTGDETLRTILEVDSYKKLC